MSAAAWGAGGKVAQGVGQTAQGLASVYGAYKGAQMADKQFEEDKMRYENELNRMKMMDEISKRQMSLGNKENLAMFGQQQEDRLQNMYGSYNKQIGR